MECMDLFCGAGGLSLGLERAGFRSTRGVEIDADACATYARFFPAADVLNSDIRSVDFTSWAGRIGLVAGGPPCQPFSSGGKRLGSQDRRDMLPEFIRVVEEVRPPLFLLENVPGLVRPGRKEYFDAMLRQLRALCDGTYQVTWGLVCAADYGVPQKRWRLIAVGSRVGRYEFPPPTHGPRVGRPYEVSGNYISKERVVGTPNPSKVVYAKNPDIRPSPYDGHLFNGGGRPINMEDLCPTILASAGGNKTHFVDTLAEVPRYHAELMSRKPPRVGLLPGGRRLTVQESAILQTFPADSTFYGSRSSQYSQVGNAVPPLLAHKLGLQLAVLLGVRKDQTAAG